MIRLDKRLISTIVQNMDSPSKVSVPDNDENMVYNYEAKVAHDTPV